MNVYVEQHGRGAPIVFIHGWGLHGGVWQPMADCLKSSAQSYLIDLPGHGYSAKPQVFSVNTAAHTVMSALDDLSGSAILVGWSMGAFIAFEMARQFPDRFSRLVWIAGTPSFIKRPGWSIGMEPDILDDFANGLEQDSRGTLRRFISLNGAGATDRTLIKKMQQQALEREPVESSVLKQGLQILRDSDIRSELSESTLPMLLLQGSQDRLVNTDTVDAVASLRSIESRIFTDLGHAPFLSEPEAVARSILDFCQ